MAGLPATHDEAKGKVKGLNFSARTEQALLRARQRLEFNIRALRQADVEP